MKQSILAIAALAALSAAAAQADCPYPAAPAKIPDGNTATLDEMMAVKKQVTEYDSAIGSYLDCIKKEHDDAVAKGGDSLTDKQKLELDHIEAQKHNAAVTQLQGVADHFNEQVRLYKAKNAKKD
ncbi:MAG TPA: hypothetical protein VGF89_13440 [Steroidobacteraceae bacterium]|jgi:hypothetical protein